MMGRFARMAALMAPAAALQGCASYPLDRTAGYVCDFVDDCRHVDADPGAGPPHQRVMEPDRRADAPER
jgi:hypothetical protein